MTSFTCQPGAVLPLFHDHMLLLCQKLNLAAAAAAAAAAVSSRIHHCLLCVLALPCLALPRHLPPSPIHTHIHQKGGISPTWFFLHRGLQLLAVLLALAGFIMALVSFKVGWGVDSATPHSLYNPHRIMGVVVMGLVLVQVSTPGGGGGCCGE
jgi:hypothetical protein